MLPSASRPLPSEGTPLALPTPPAPVPRRPASLVALVVLGIALVLAPVVFQMFERAPKGAEMIGDFEPFMTEQRLSGFQADIGKIRAAVAEVDAQAPRDGVEPPSSYQALSEQWPTIDEDMSGLLDDVSANRENYEAVASLPPFGLFPWFFVVPGVLVAGIAAWALVRRPDARGPRVALALIGVGLVAAPAVFGMFAKAPKGGEMMGAFEQIETRENVATIQGYFATMATGQGALRLDVVPALEKQGLSPAEVAARYPATTALNEDWVHVLNDMTPMIGAMSDNVDNYEAVRSLPPFPLFPWFFVVPGVLVVVLALAGRRNRTQEVGR